MENLVGAALVGEEKELPRAEMHLQYFIQGCTDIDDNKSHFTYTWQDYT